MVSQEEPLTATEAADRVGKRRGPRQQRSDSECPYVCESCGGSRFFVVRDYERQQNVRETLNCNCGKSEVAAVREYIKTDIVTVIGRLGDDHRMEWGVDCDGDEVEEDVVQEDVVETESNVECNACLEGASPEDWDYEPLDDCEVMEDSEHFEIRCTDCDHEIEFGWSHPDRGGRIWPCESADFNPWKSWPEPRFVDDWNRRGWLRPLRQE